MSTLPARHLLSDIHLYWYVVQVLRNTAVTRLATKPLASSALGYALTRLAISIFSIGLLFCAIIDDLSTFRATKMHCACDLPVPKLSIVLLSER